MPIGETAAKSAPQSHAPVLLTKSYSGAVTCPFVAGVCLYLWHGTGAEGTGNMTRSRAVGGKIVYLF
jgi:hypothetical protein